MVAPWDTKDPWSQRTTGLGSQLREQSPVVVASKSVTFEDQRPATTSTPLGQPALADDKGYASANEKLHLGMDRTGPPPASSAQMSFRPESTQAGGAQNESSFSANRPQASASSAQTSFRPEQRQDQAGAEKMSFRPEPATLPGNDCMRTSFDPGGGCPATSSSSSTSFGPFGAAKGGNMGFMGGPNIMGGPGMMNGPNDAVFNAALMSSFMCLCVEKNHRCAVRSRRGL